MKLAVKAICAKNLGEAALTLLLLAGLALLVGCQGISVGGSPGQQTSSLAMATTTLDFGSLPTGNSKTLTVSATNSGPASVTVSSATISTKYFSLTAPGLPIVIAAGQSATISIAFTPNAAGAFNATLTVTSDASNPAASVALSGTGTAAAAGQLTPNSTTEAFGNVTVGKTQTLSETLTNTGGSSVTVSQVGVSGTGFTLSGITAPVTLTAGQSASFSVIFSPTSAGSASGNITITSTASNPTLTIPVSGTGTTAVGQLGVTPATLAVGSVVDGTSGSASGSLTATGANVTVTAASTNNSVFSVGGISLPVTIAAGQSLPFTITFSPQITGAASATLTITSNAQPSSTTEALTGTGTAAPTHSVNLSWNASTSSSISGYNVYRAVYKTSCGSYVKINSVVNTTTLYSDPSVVDGTSYCYAATAVNSSNQESSYSNIVSNIQIPAP